MRNVQTTRWRWRDLPLRHKGLVLVFVPLLPLLVTAGLFFVTQRSADDADARVGNTLRSMALVGVGGVLVGLAGSVATALLFTSGMVRRVHGVTANARRLAEGKPLEPLPPSADEIGDLGRAVEDAATLLQRRSEELETQLREKQTAIGELESFSYSVSHDLRAPLRHVIGFASLLEKHSSGGLDAEGRRYLTTISRSAARMGHLIDDLLTFSQMSRTELMTSEVDLNKLVAGVVADLERETSHREVVWTIRPLPPLRGDAAMLRLALMNLVSNAVKYTSTRQRAEIEIGSLRASPDEAVIYVRDNGVGFDMAYADKLFGVFQRLHRADEFEGTGIGLANVRRIIQRHGGRTWAEGIVNAGATIYVSLPAPSGLLRAVPKQEREPAA